MIGKSKSIEALFKVARKASGYDTTVLISGESGTGKELIAKGIHFSGNRASMPIVCLNCAGIPENLLESELFGYTKGSFTGADRNKKGLFEEAQGGTIFLDEIGDMPLSLQAKLLRVLQEKEVRPIGAAETKNLDVRVIAATAQNLEEKVKQRTFREDLFYRLNVLAVQVPPLRERREDIPLLCRHFVSRFNAKLGRKIRGISRPAMRQLIEHSWPGNVRQLENAIERAVVLSDKDIIDVDILPAELGAHAIEDGPDACFKQQSLKVAQRMLEEKLIRKALQTSHGNRSQAARLLEISHPSLLSKMKRYQINA